MQHFTAVRLVRIKDVSLRVHRAFRFASTAGGVKYERRFVVPRLGELRFGTLKDFRQQAFHRLERDSAYAFFQNKVSPGFRRRICTESSVNVNHVFQRVQFFRGMCQQLVAQVSFDKGGFGSGVVKD